MSRGLTNDAFNTFQLKKGDLSCNEPVIFFAQLIFVTTAKTLGGELFLSRGPFCTENAKVWPILAILLQIYELFGALFQG